METKTLAQALVKAQGEYALAIGDMVNGRFNSKYCSLKALQRATRPALEKYGLSIIQRTIPSPDASGLFVLETILRHESGEKEISQWPIAPQKTDIQSIGSYVTMAARYSYRYITGVMVSDDEDDDGNMVTPTKSIPDKVNQKQLVELEDALRNHVDIKNFLLDQLQISSLSHVNASAFDALMNRIPYYIDKKTNKSA